jgi:hypothetical protein
MPPTILSTTIIMDCVLSEEPAVRQIYDRMRALVHRFDREVWAKGFQSQNRDQQERGMRQARRTLEARLIENGDGTDRINILGYTISGRTMLTLQRGEVMLSMVADESCVGRTGLQGIQGTEAEVTLLVEDAIAQWADHPHIEPDQDVRIAGF